MLFDFLIILYTRKCKLHVKKSAREASDADRSAKAVVPTTFVALKMGIGLADGTELNHFLKVFAQLLVHCRTYIVPP